MIKLLGSKWQQKDRLASLRNSYRDPSVHSNLSQLIMQIQANFTIFIATIFDVLQQFIKSTPFHKYSKFNFHTTKGHFQF